MKSILEQMLSKYEIESENDTINALKEIFQEITLLGLYRGDFYKKAAFYGGTSLRILYGLNRFSEDLDFTLLEKNENFRLEPYFPFIIDEFEALGINITINTKKKKVNTSNIESAFLKNGTSIHSLHFFTEEMGAIIKGIHPDKKIKIKLEIDINPPLRFQTEPKTLLMPVTFNVLSMTLPNLYAGKMHAVLFRNWKTRVKGRDWFDFEWYVKHQVELNLEHLQQRMIESEKIEEPFRLTKEIFIELMYSKIDQLDIKKAVAEVSPFLKDSSVLGFWDKEYFKHLVTKVLYL